MYNISDAQLNNLLNTRFPAYAKVALIGVIGTPYCDNPIYEHIVVGYFTSMKAAKNFVNSLKCKKPTLHKKFMDGTDLSAFDDIEYVELDNEPLTLKVIA